MGKTIAIFLLALLAIGCKTDYKIVGTHGGVINEDTDTYTLNGVFRGLASRDTVNVYIHTPSNVVQTKSFHKRYHLTLPKSDFYIIYFVSDYGHAKKIVITNCGDKGFFYYTDISFSSTKAIIMFRQDPWGDVIVQEIQTDGRLNYGTIGADQK